MGEPLKLEEGSIDWRKASIFAEWRVSIGWDELQGGTHLPSKC